MTITQFISGLLGKNEPTDTEPQKKPAPNPQPKQSLACGPSQRAQELFGDVTKKRRNGLSSIFEQIRRRVMGLDQQRGWRI